MTLFSEPAAAFTDIGGSMGLAYRKIKGGV
jgi:hypothetical protein